MARQIRVDIIGDSASLERAFSRSKLGAEGFNSTIGRLSVGFGALAKSVVIVDAVQKAIEGLTASVHLGVAEFKEHATVTAQTEAALKSTGGIANITAKQIDALGLALSNLSGIDDEVIQGGENVLLAFQNIRNFAGKGNQIFTDATKATVDFAIRSGRSVQAAGVAIGRALQDPAKAAGSLRRAYVVLTASEKAAIASAVAHGDILKAQRLIVADLERRYGGAAEAAGKTLPGALNILRDRFKDLAGSGIGLIAPALTRATRSLTDFVVRFTAAQGARAKFNLVFDGLENVGRDLFNAVEKQIRSIDFAKIGDEVGKRLGAIDWRAKIEAAGRKAGEALIASLDALRSLLGRVNWENVGQQLVRGIAIAIGAFVDFLAHVNWGAIADATMRLVVTAFKASGLLLIGIGEALSTLLVNGIFKGFDIAAVFLEKKAAELVLKIIEPFTHLPGFLGGGPFQDMKKSLQTTLDQMAGVGQKGGHNIGAAVAAGIAAGVGPASTPGGAIPQAIAKAIGSRRNFDPNSLPGPPDPTGPKPRPGVSAAQRNTFFDNAITRLLTRSGLGTLQQQLAGIAQASVLITKRLAATKDVTRKLTLEDELLQLASQSKALRQQIAGDFLSSLQLGFTKAQATSGLNDDLASLQAINAAIRAEIKEFGTTAQLRGDLFANQQQIAQTRQTQRDRAQFFALGLSPTGGDRIPFVANLKKQGAALSAAITGTVFDTAKNRAFFTASQKILNSVIPPSSAVRERIAAYYATVRSELGKGLGDVTKFKHANTESLLSGLGLSAETTRVLRQRLAQVGAGGTVPGARSQAFALAGATTFQADLTVNLDGAKVAKNTTTHQVKQGRRRSSSRRN